MTRWFWFIGPESTVYHNYKDCSRLNNVYRYWPIEKTKTPPIGRTLCKGCEKRAKKK